MDDQNKNLILATGLSFLVILVWFLLFPPDMTTPVVDPAATSRATTPGSDAQAPTASAPAPQAVGAESPRVKVETPELTGTISLHGGRIDDLSLKTYRETVDPASPLVRLLSPVGKEDAYYAVYGWVHSVSAFGTASNVRSPAGTQP